MVGATGWWFLAVNPRSRLPTLEPGTHRATTPFAIALRPFGISNRGRIRSWVPVPEPLPSLSSFCAAVSEWRGLHQSRLSFLHRANAGVLLPWRWRVWSCRDCRGHALPHPCNPLLHLLASLGEIRETNGFIVLALGYDAVIEGDAGRAVMQFPNFKSGGREVGDV